jgi:hypothetical protein
MTVNERLTREIRYDQLCPSCGHDELIRKDYRLDVFDIMTVPFGPSPGYVPSYGPQEPDKPQAPNEFWSRVHCDECKTHLHTSIITTESVIIYDSEMVSYKEALEAWNASRQ